MDYFDGVAARLIELAPDHRLVGRIRLQKVAYLLTAMGLETGLTFSYYHYGPYSRDLDQGTDDAKSLRRVNETPEYRNSDGAAYSVFTLAQQPQDVPLLDLKGMDEARARDLVRRFAAVPSTVLELAATAHWLVDHEKVADWQTEITLRKGVKTQGGRLEKAVSLLRECGLRPGLPEAA